MSEKKRGRPRKRGAKLGSSQKLAERPAEPAFNDEESPLLWLAKRTGKDGQPMISQTEYTAGERLRADFFFAQMTPRTTVNWSAFQAPGTSAPAAPDLGPEMHQAVHSAQERVRRALKAVGPGLAGVLIDVCCYLRGLEMFEKTMRWPQRTGKIILRIALQHLAIHYGIVTDNDPRITAPRAINRWGTPDYKPRIVETTNLEGGGPDKSGGGSTENT